MLSVRARASLWSPTAGGPLTTQKSQEELGQAEPTRATARPNALVRSTFVLFMASVAFDMLPLIGEHFAVTRVFGILFAASALTQPRILRRPPPVFWFFALYAAIVFVLGIPLFDLYGSQILARVATLVQLLIMFWLTYCVMQDERTSGTAMITFGLACLLIASLMMAGYGQTIVRSVRGVRLSFLGANANSLAGTMALGLLGLVGIAYTARLASRAWRYVVPGVAMLLAFAIMDTGSRGAVIGIAGGLIVLLAHGESAARRLRNLALFAVLGSFLYFAVYSTYIARVRWEDALVTRRVSGRERIFPSLAAMFAERPFVGWGPEKNRRELGGRVGITGTYSLDAHNLYLHVLTETGLLGCLPFFAGLLMCLRSARRAIGTRHGLVPLVLLVAALAANLSANWVIRKPLWFALAYATASGAVVVTRTRPGGKRKGPAGIASETP